MLRRKLSYLFQHYFIHICCIFPSLFLVINLTILSVHQATLFQVRTEQVRRKLSYLFKHSFIHIYFVFPSLILGINLRTLPGRKATLYQVRTDERTLRKVRLGLYHQGISLKEIKIYLKNKIKEEKRLKGQKSQT